MMRYCLLTVIGFFSFVFGFTQTPYVYLFGNLHAHSSYSDGNKSDTTKHPIDDYIFAREANCMDFLGISEHNHATAGLQIAKYHLGLAQADNINGVVSSSGKSIVTLWGMEWGVISNGGHVIVYGFDNQLIGWEPGNYDIFCAEYDYVSLWNLINAHSGAFATLAHPQQNDYTNLANGAYNHLADSAIYGVAVESGPAFSTSTSYNDFPSSLSYLPVYQQLLAKGYHLGAQMDQDTHYMTFGESNTNRMVVLATDKTRAALVEAIRSMRFYASEDCNVRVDYKCGASVMGSSVTANGVASLSLNVTDPDAGETVASIALWGGQVGSSIPIAPLKTYTSGATTVSFSASDAENVQPNNTTYYYYAVITQGDGNKIVTSPIWYNRNDIVTAVSSVPEASASFNVYPNPSRGVTYLHSTNISGPVSIEVKDISGRVAFKLDKVIYPHSTIPIPLEGLARGTYFVNLATKANTQVIRIIVDND